MKLSIAAWALAALFVFVPVVLPVIEPTGSSGFVAHTVAFFASIFILVMIVTLGFYQMCWAKFRGKAAILVLSLDLFFAAMVACIAMRLSNQ